ncbi:MULTISPECIES: DUF2970 domain-containing protein [Idiomarina]|jgi:uncharacterized membrane protein YidH (DUF202 family)|uniref:DUF2970 domain-containing protein n=1 Tax=Idiomarina abyssalis TaxID=86102 RepID=A0A8I1G7E5_9GAMM|nr:MULTISPECIES: DUF2970 domain-containing protein [Idiomarina]KPD21171.1 hypothetical protein ADS78_09035 [Idiomarina abyssalis]MAB22458.1 DUF2970 domain-containing protein [Idiomarina sp.]MAO66961.1 DUF2970 domain-containing protein [Idiomarina sp.]MBE91351.1 DUF2970 domain-containing protein [Idiomarina sp.]MBF81363.1 DUF2970 domain-containing protein [Idiomarina sp.]|tara:strand:+ start:1033 stop:1254 length:222 start_codon:yes stop_codon:yes gene_type:complete
MSDSSDNKAPKLGIVSMVVSVLAAFLGVQTEKNRQRDFQHGSPKAYIIIGVILTILFVLGLVGLVNIVMANVA